MLGDDTDIEIHALDETNTLIDPKRLARMVEQAGAGMVMLVGVQSNQFPRALDIARPLRERGIAVGIGGFHVSGVLSMLDGKDEGLDEAKAMGCSLFAGEAEEGRLDEVLRDAAAGTLKPLYNYMADLPSIEGTPIPMLVAERVNRTAGGVTSFDAGRGCPYQCSFCTIINVQGRKSRRRSPDDIEKIVRANVAQGLHSFFITDDNFARNKDWEIILDRLIALREVEGMKISVIIQVDTLCHQLPNFIEKCARAGVKRVFIGLENINPANLMSAKKRQNKITEYRKMLLAWKQARILTYAGYILGFRERHAGIDPARHRRHQARAAGRSSGVLLPHAAAGIGRSSEAVPRRRAARSRSQQVRSEPRLHAARAHVGRGMEDRLSHGVAALLHARAHRDDHAPRRRHARERRQCAVPDHLVHRLDQHREDPSAGKRFAAPPLPHRTPPGLSDRAGVALLSGLLYTNAGQDFPLGRALSTGSGCKYLAIRKDPRRFDYRDIALTPVTDEDEKSLEMFQSDAARASSNQEHHLDAVRHGTVLPAAE